MVLFTGLPRVKVRVLITGGSGFIGTNLMEMYASRGCEVVNLDISKPRNYLHSKYWREVDILDGSALTRSVREFNPDVVFHMAARTDLDGTKVESYLENTLGVQNMIDAIKGVGSLRRAIFASSRLVCKIGYAPKNEYDYFPTTPYGESKVAGELIVRDAMDQLDCEILIVRPTSIWGPWFEIPYKNFFLAIANKQYFHPGSIKILKSFGYVENTIYELDKLMYAPPSSVVGKTFYLADYPPVDVAFMANTIQETMRVPPIKHLSINVLRIIALFGDIFKILGWRNPPLTSFRLNNLVTPMEYELNPLKEVVGDLPYSMEDGVKKTIAWMRSQEIIR
jgi:nucleoside-diphosphate-sugar epimerase